MVICFDVDVLVDIPSVGTYLTSDFLTCRIQCRIQVNHMP